MYHSFSSWQLFLSCPYNWHARYISKKEEKRPDSPALIKGREVHKFMEETVKNGTLEANKGKIAPSVYETLKSIVDGSCAVKTEIDLYCDYGAKIIQKDWSNPDGVVIKIDLLSISNNGIGIYDYKTGASKGHREQLALYSTPFNKDIKAGFLYMDQNSVDKFDISEKEASNNWGEFLRYVDYAENNKAEEEKFEKKACRNCKYCQVKDCEIKQLGLF